MALKSIEQEWQDFKECGKMLGIQVIDHIVVGDNRAVSLQECLMRYFPIVFPSETLLKVDHCMLQSIHFPKDRGNHDILEQLAISR